MATENMTKRDFQREVLTDKSPVLVVFRAGWCVPSVQLAPVVENLAATNKGRVKVVTIDVGSDPKKNAIAREYDVTRVPVVMLFNEGRVKDFIGGQTSQEDIAAMIDRQLRPVFDVGVYDFDTEVLKSDVPVLVHFHARWCAASQELLPVVDSMAEQFRGRAKVARMEFGPETAQLCAQYGIRRVPTLALFEGGQIKDQILGAMRGGTKSPERATSCVGLTSIDNVAQMLNQFVR